MLKFGADSDVWLPLVFVLLLVPITLIDLEFTIIPNSLTLIGAVAAIVLTAAFESDQLVAAPDRRRGRRRLLPRSPRSSIPAGMGMGDVKLAGVMGLVLGRAVVPAIFAALLLGTIVGAGVMARYGVKEGRKKGIPFGPWLAAGSLVGLFAGDADRRLVPRHLHRLTPPTLGSGPHAPQGGYGGCRYLGT